MSGLPGQLVQSASSLLGAAPLRGLSAAMCRPFGRIPVGQGLSPGGTADAHFGHRMRGPGVEGLFYGEKSRKSKPINILQQNNAFC